MKKILLFTLFLLVGSSALAQKSLYDFKVKAIDGTEFDMKSLKGKKVMIVNVASECGLTPQYKDLEALYKTYGGDKFVIIAFPANNFGAQEPGSNADIANFCSENYQITFPMMEKISVKGDDIAPIYQWLTTKKLNGVLDTDVLWNFQKFLVDENGKLIESIHPRELPNSPKIVKWITGK